MDLYGLKIPIEVYQWVSEVKLAFEGGQILETLHYSSPKVYISFHLTHLWHHVVKIFETLPLVKYIFSS